MHDVVVGIDYSDVSERAFKAALEVAARRSGSRVHVLAVAEGQGAGLPEDMKEEAREEFLNQARTTLQEFIDDKLSDYQTPVKRHNIRLAVDVGNPAERIVVLAREVEANIIVVGSHSKSRLERAVVGSVADSVLKDAPCSVMVIRPEDE